MDTSFFKIRTQFQGFIFAAFCFSILVCLLLTPPGRAEADPILAEIGEHKITLRDLDNKINNILKIQEHIGESVKPDKEAVLLEMVRLDVFAKEALALGLEKDNEVTARINNLQKKNLSGKEELLQKDDHQEDKARTKVIKDYVLATAYLQKEVDDKINISDEEILNTFKDNRLKYMEPENIKARQIFIMADSETDMDRAQKEAERILERLKNGEDFITLAREFSDDSLSKDSGGDLEYFARGRLVPELEEPVFHLRKGEISPILKTSGGFHIFKLEDRIEGKPMEYQDAREEIVKKLKDEKRNESYKAIEEKLFKKYEVKIYKERIPTSSSPLTEK